MASTARELITKIFFQSNKEELDQIEKKLDGIKKAIEFLAAAEVVKAVAEMTERFAKFGEELHIAAESAGITVEAFQKMAFAAKLSGVSQDELSNAMFRMNRQLGEAKIGSAQALQAFTQLGLDPNRFKNTEEAFYAVQGALKGVSNDAQRTQIMFDIFGRSSRRLTDLMLQGSGVMQARGKEAVALGAVLSEKQVEALTEMEHSFQKLFSAVQGFGAMLASYLGPSITDAVNDLLKFYEANKKIIDTDVKLFFHDLLFWMGATWEGVRLLLQVFFDWIKNHQQLAIRIAEVAAVLGTLIGVIFLASQVFRIFSFVLGPVTGLLKTFGTAGLWLVRTVIWPMISGLFEMTAAFFATPFGWVTAGILGLVLAGQALWQVLHGGKFSDTWLGQLLTGAGHLTQMAEGLIGGIFGAGKSAIGAVSPLVSGAAAALGNGTSADINALIGGFTNIPQGIGPSDSSSPTVGGGQYQINAPIEINVPAGTDPRMVGDHVQRGVRDAMDRTLREAHRSLRPSLSY